MAKRFDKAIKVLQDEIYREAGKVANQFAKHGHLELAIKTASVKNLQTAIEILSTHNFNKMI